MPPCFVGGFDNTTGVGTYGFAGTIKKAFSTANIHVSTPILNEYREVPLTLETERKVDHRQLKALIPGIATFLANAETVRPGKNLRVHKDEKDNMALA